MRNIYIATFFLSITAAIPADLFVPSMPAIAKFMMADSRAVQLTMIVFVFGFAAAQFFYGPLSDFYGRKKIIFFALVITFFMI